MENNFNIRKANIKDLKEILRLNLELFNKEHREFGKNINLKWTHSKAGRKHFKEKITEKDGFVEVVETNGKVIGYLCGGISKKLSFGKKAKYAELQSIFLEKKFRGKGLGSKLIKNFINWCKKKKVNYISLTVSVKNIITLTLYRKLGFKDEALILEKKLR